MMGRKVAWRIGKGLILMGAAGLLAACGGGGGSGPALQTQPQSLSFGATPTLPLGGTATVGATASSGLAVSYGSTTKTICTVDSSSGLVTALSIGTCTLTADQSGDERFAPAAQIRLSVVVTYSPNQSITVSSAPTTMNVGGVDTVAATASSGLAVAYSSSTPAVCSIDASTGHLTALVAGACTVLVDQAGDSNYLPALQVSRSLSVVAPAAAVPGTPAGVTATSGSSLAEVVVDATSVSGGGSAVVGYMALSSPSGFTATSTTLPVRVSCTGTASGTCAGESFSLRATNASGTGAASSNTHIVDTYDVTTVFYEPDTQPNNSIFVGTFTYDATDNAVSNLQGRLSESMTGGLVAYPNDTMTWVTLSYQLQTWHDASLGGTYVASFSKSTTATFMGNTWTPQDGVDWGGVFAGGPNMANYSSSTQNSYVLIFVPDFEPPTTLTTAQLNMLAYADCAPGGMMGAVCMTGTTVAGYGAIGTMSGYPVSQTITRRY